MHPPPSSTPTANLTPGTSGHVLPATAHGTPSAGSISPQPPPRRGSTPAIMTAPLGRRGSIAKYAANVPAAVQHSQPTVGAAGRVSPDAVGVTYSVRKPLPDRRASIRARSIKHDKEGKEYAASTLEHHRNSFAPTHVRAEFATKVHPWLLYFVEPTAETEYERDFSEKQIWSWRVYVMIGAIGHLVLACLNNALPLANRSWWGATTSITATSPQHVAVPGIMMAMYLLVLALSFRLSEKRLAQCLHPFAALIFITNTLLGATLYAVVLRPPTTFFEPAFLYVVATTTTSLLLRLRYLVVFSCSLCSWILFMVAGAVACPWPAYPVQDYVFVGLLTFLVLGTVIAFAFESERRARYDFFASQYYVSGSTRLMQQLAALVMVRTMAHDPGLSAAHAETLQAVLRLLQSSNVLVPDLQSQLDRAAIDAEQQSWLFSEVAPRRSQILPQVLSRRQLPGVGSTVIQSNTISESGAALPSGTPVPMTGTTPRCTGTAARSTSPKMTMTASQLILHHECGIEWDAASMCVQALRISGTVMDTARLAPRLAQLESWNWNIFDFARDAHGMPLLLLAATLFAKEHLFTSLAIPVDRFLRCISKIEAGYATHIPYHNSTHACDVLHGCHVLLSSDAVKGMVTDLERAAIYFAAIIHDHQHPGVNNLFLISTGDHKATLYNDRSVLENHHLASAFAVLKQDEYNFTAEWTQEARKDFRALVVDLVLATDLQQHLVLLGSFKARIEHFNPASNKDDRQVLWKIIIKASDVSNPSKELGLYLEWTQRIMAEFFAQGDEERRLGLPISPFMDRHAANYPGCQLGFIGFICKPLYESVHQVCPIPVQMAHLRSNVEFWEQRKAAGITSVLRVTPPAIAETPATAERDTVRSTSRLDVFEDAEDADGDTKKHGGGDALVPESAGQSTGAIPSRCEPDSSESARLLANKGPGQPGV
ncbi:hypothetical protein AMAG_07364 [Allomyces macrogynus ATCC 38327]|uniref:PDEase domain-containing protein n=1 Tax=Allomyces macrogynus (strain ATCC 38327) TaxID=578462 RepID=A0A0L0SI35_ALLM3|nr:hypothetical protein AMAG_07364 [Allomyces macrogynus ATCC 38327]|eukprot:KNE62117.1 hypothetical protein AMAG_07364 [Allomyces macrogynus ATCC 38327]